MDPGRPEPSSEPIPWANADGRRTVFLIDASSGVERRLLEEWIEAHRPATSARGAYETISIPPSRRRRRNERFDPRLEATLASGDDPLLAPLRVAWSVEEDGLRPPGLARLLTFRDPRDPSRFRQAILARRRRPAYRIVVAEPAPASELRSRWRRSGGADLGETHGLTEFVTRQATLALERAERRIRGARYKVPRLVLEDILARPAFRGGLARLARELGRPESEVTRLAADDLREIAAAHSPYLIDLVAHLIRFLYTRAYNERLRYDRRELSAIYALTQRHPVVFLPSHKSNLDHLVLQYMLYENGHPPNHTAGGINMNFFPLGPLVRRSGTFFIRRSFKDDPVYKFVLRSYVDYLIEKRFSLEWYIEGGRSRSGKLLPPRLGLLTYVVDSYRRGKAEDMALVPVAIAYDQIQDVGDYVAESRGGSKERESLGWLVKVLKGFRRRSGDIHIRFGEPLLLQSALDSSVPREAPDADERSVEVQKLAFEVAVRINRATPITPTSLVTLALLGSGDRALTVDEVVKALENLVEYVRRRRLPTTVELDLETADGVRTTLEVLVASGVVSCFSEGLEPVYAIGPEQHLAAAYYRNTIIHFFVNGAIAELALVRAAEDDVTDPAGEFWDAAMRLRDLLKFEFFFSEKEEFRRELREELALHDCEWEAHLPHGADEIRSLLGKVRPFSAHRVLCPFLEAYRIVGDSLERGDPVEPVAEKDLFRRCLALGRQYLLQHRVRSAESVSQVLFATALSLARNRGLVDSGGDELVERRRAFAAEIRDLIRRTDAIDALAASRRAGLIG